MYGPPCSPFPPFCPTYARVDMHVIRCLRTPHGANQRLGVPRRRASRQTTAAGSSQLNGVRGLVRKFPMAEARMVRTELDPVASRRLPFSPAARRLRLSPAPCMLATMHFVSSLQFRVRPSLMGKYTSSIPSCTLEMTPASPLPTH